jgi:activator of HSP90 ATPase
MERLRLATTFDASPDDVYEAWISGDLHAAMTGSAATSVKRKGGAFTAWDGYISGTHVELEPGKRILQSWRTKEFPDKAPDSVLEIRLARTGKATRITLLQSGIPDGQSDMYTDGWQKFYFDPMTVYFETKTAPSKKKAEHKVAPAKTKKKNARPAKVTKKAAKKTAPAKPAAKKRITKKRRAKR